MESFHDRRALLWFGPRTTQERLAQIAAWASVIGSAAQFLAQLPFVLKLVPALRIALAVHLDSVQTVLRNFRTEIFPLSRGVVQLSAFVDSIIASYLPIAAVSALGYAQTLYLLPVSLFGMSVSASELPEMSSAVGSRDEIAAHLRRRLLGGLRRIAFFVIPSVVAFVALGDIIAGAIYQRRKFTHDDAVFVWGILAGAGVGLLASAQGRLYFSAFYALKDTPHAAPLCRHPGRSHYGIGLSCGLPSAAAARSESQMGSGWINRLGRRQRLDRISVTQKIAG